ncbi:MAG: ZIP family metal transporter [Firmicutes bacterium]|nr:ZIP family metal transporter [Bacillota bacterium]
MAGIVLQGLIAGLGTCLGAMLVISFGRIHPAAASLLLGLAAGIMAAVVLFDLLPSSLLYGNFSSCLAGFAAGALIMVVTDGFLNRLPRTKRRGRSFLRIGYLIAAGIAMHDLPEGFAIAAGFAAAEKLGPLLVLAIGLHNIPEGMATAAPLRMGGMRPGRVLLLNAAISLITPAGTILGILLIDVSRSFTGLLLAFAAGAMSYIILSGLIPESCRQGRSPALLGMLAGALLIAALNVIA